MTTPTIERARWFPEMPPALDGESSDAYTDRLTGADRTGRVPYDHSRNRQCSIGYHDECSERGVRTGVFGDCHCPCHTEAGALELRLHELEETAVALYAIATGRLRDEMKRPGWSGRILDGEAERIAAITSRRPKLAEWYLRPEKETTSP